MRSAPIRPLSALVAATGGMIYLSCPTSAAAQFSGNVTLTTDYVWRGSSQTRQSPAAQAGVKYALPSGLYASVWGSNVKFRPDNGAASEFDLALGWAGKLSDDWALDLYGLRNQYPRADAALTWNEVNLALSWRDHAWLSVGHSSNAMASGGHGTYVLLGARHPFNDQWRAEVTLARYLLDRAHAPSYTHGSVGVVWAFKAPFEARLTVHATDAAARRLFPGMAGTRAELALQAAF